jgi:threonine dehydrogenase-like Zn-dependent dehydrogenase
LTVGFHAAARARIVQEDTTAVFGCGAVGLGAIAGSAFRGAETIAIDMDDAKLEIARKAGAKHCINSAREDLNSKLANITDGRGPDVAIEAIGLPVTFRTAVEVVAFTGRVVYIGYAKEPVTYETRLFVQKELDILGSRNALPENFYQVIGTTVNTLIRSGFVLAHVNEWGPSDDQIGVHPEWAEHRDRPMFLLVSAKKECGYEGDRTTA